MFVNQKRPDGFERPRLGNGKWFFLIESLIIEWLKTELENVHILGFSDSDGSKLTEWERCGKDKNPWWGVSKPGEGTWETSHRPWPLPAMAHEHGSKPVNVKCHTCLRAVANPWHPIDSSATLVSGQVAAAAWVSTKGSKLLTTNIDYEGQKGSPGTDHALEVITQACPSSLCCQCLQAPLQPGVLARSTCYKFGQNIKTKPHDKMIDPRTLAHRYFCHCASWYRVSSPINLVCNLTGIGGQMMRLRWMVRQTEAQAWMCVFCVSIKKEMNIEEIIGKTDSPSGWRWLAQTILYLGYMIGTQTCGPTCALCRPRFHVNVNYIVC